ncbi:hypothetical protein [Dysgonomonas sp. GY617]|uniref:hypothetical protein n=1 Tax=Dysgonomonas sp. GY617 TaxID=2780420 RepID=UPI001883A56F|nr:hypothetical protein [Dysgonomonas sp. GY617]MBF0578106.1 hypothetical protein [Dysgonomonas sp. GY617]
MDLFDYALSEDVEIGKYRTSFFHLIMNGDIGWSIKIQLSPDFGTFMHYIQDISTLHGIAWSEWYLNYLLICKDHIHVNKNIELPIKVPYERYSNFKAGKDIFDRIKGSDYNNYIEIDDLYVLKEEIKVAKDKHESVTIHRFNFNDETIDSFEFGYTCIIESMAHLFQTFFDSSIEHQDVPYNTVQKICKVEYPEIASNKKMLITLCLASLNSQNPGLFFFECIEKSKRNRELNGIEFYDLIIREYSFWYKRRKYSYHDFMKKYIGRLKHILQNNQRVPLEYYNRVLDSVLLQTQHYQSALLFAIYQNDFPSQEGLDFLFDNNGLPYIETSSHDYFPCNHKTGMPYRDSVFLFSSELVIKRFKKKEI